MRMKILTVAAGLMLGTATMTTGVMAGHGGGGGFRGGGALTASARTGGGTFTGGGVFTGRAAPADGARIGGFRGFDHRRYGYRGYGYGGGIYPWWGYEEYPWEYEYYYEPACGYVHVKYYRHKRAYWRWVYRCY